MKNFNYYNPANILFGQGEEEKVGELISSHTHTKKVLLLYSGDYLTKLGIEKTISKQLSEQHIKFFKNGNIVPNPDVALVRELVSFVKEHEIDFLLAVGGGSVIDTAKAVSFGALYEGDVWDFFTGKVAVTRSLPVGVISTVASSGSEMSNATIISNGPHKLGVESELIIPKFSILNPAYTTKLPKYYTGVGISDILTHLLERYFTKVSHVTLTNYLLEGAIKSLLVSGSKLIDDLDNYHLRAEVMWTSSMAHNNSLELGREPDWGSHRIEHELSGQYGIVHGEGMAIIFPAWMEYVSQFYPDIFVQYAVQIFDINPFAYETKEEIITLGIQKTREFFKKMGMKTSLTELNIDETHFEQMANRATNDDSQTVGHLMPLTSSDIIAIFQLAR